MSVQEDDDRFHYMLLCKMKQNCLYVIDWQFECLKGLDNNCVDTHIEEMKRLYHIVPVEPEWISLADIEQFRTELNAINGVE